MPTIAEQWKQEGIEQGIEKGIEQGIEKGEVIGRILAMEEFLGRESTNKKSLIQLSLDVLQAKANELRQAMRNGR